MTEAIIAAVAGIISGILAGTISSRIYVSRYVNRSQDTQTLTSSPGAKHDDHGQTATDSTDVIRDNFGTNKSPDNRVGDMSNRSQTARSEGGGDAFNIGGDQNNRRG